MFGRWLAPLLLWPRVCAFGDVTPVEFSADVDGWRIDATSSELKLTWLTTGAIWHSPLFTVTARVRTAKTHMGGWFNEIVREQHGGKAVLNRAEMVSDHVVLEGSIETPFGSSELWKLQLKPDKDIFKGMLSFELHLLASNRSSDVPELQASDRSCPKNIQACYTYASTDVSMLWNMHTSEHIVGAGEQFSSVDLRGQQFDIWSGEQGIGRGRMPITPLVDLIFPYQAGNAHTTYSHVPALLSTQGYGIALQNSQLVNVDLTSSVAAATVSFENTMSSELVVSGHIFGGSDVRSLLPALTTLTGRMSSPPGWVLDGLIVGTEGGHEIVSAQLETLIAANVSVVGVWIQDWSGMIVGPSSETVWWNWELDEARYPKSWLKSMAARGIRVLTYVNNMLASKSNSEGRPPAVFLEAKKLGHLVTDTEGEPLVMWDPLNGIPYGQVDVLREDAWQWWVQVLRCNVFLACEDGEDGKPLVHGFMHDYGEQLIFNASVPAALGVASDVHNLYPYRNAAAGTAAAKGLPDVAFFTRAGNLQTPGVTSMFWLGDQLTSYDACDGLQSAVIGAMSGGMSGWTVTGTDLGGFTMIDVVPVPGLKFVRDSELMVRWLEVGVFLNSMYRSHPGVKPNSSSQLWHSDVIEHSKNLTWLFGQLRPYRQALLEDAAQVGLPPVRHGLLVQPDDATWFSHRSVEPWAVWLECRQGAEVGLQQFFFGDEVMVAPVYAAGRKSVEVYIPSGDWAHLWTGSVVSGPKHVSWPAPLGQPAAFYRVDSAARWRSFFQALTERLRGTTPHQDDDEVVV